MSEWLRISPVFLILSGYNLLIRYSQPKLRKVLGHQVLTRDGYDHCRLFSKDGTLLALIPLKRFKWYLKKGLATQIDENSIQLNFEANGNGNAGDDFYLKERKNHCICCGTDDNFTKHHVVPQEYRINFPLSMKSHSSHDIVLLCSDCHEIYETEAMKFKKELSKKYEIPIEGTGTIIHKDILKIQKDVGALIKHKDKIPNEKKKEILGNVKNFLKKDLIDEEIDFDKIMKLESVDKSNYVTHGKGVIQKITKNDIEKNIKKIEEFEIMWRSHFIDTMSPEFLDENWSVFRSSLKK
eukprot:gene1124-10638_t